MNTQRKLYFISSSQANRLYKSAIKKVELNKEFLIINCTKPGACYQKVPFPDFANITKDDIVIFQLFGNDLMKRHIQITKNDGQKLFICYDLFQNLMKKYFAFFTI